MRKLLLDITELLLDITQVLPILLNITNITNITQYYQYYQYYKSKITHYYPLLHHDFQYQVTQYYLGGIHYQYDSKLPILLNITYSI